ncbi:MAG: CopG family transcriptional regulator [Rubrobacter sp.]|nr:CopG family transcriptional regulator [Rubrobacter sp.]
MATERQEKQNVTLSLPREVVREAKVIAAQRDTSISALMVGMLRELVDEERGYRAAREQSLRRLREGFDLGTGGRVSWSRDELHER